MRNMEFEKKQLLTRELYEKKMIELSNIQAGKTLIQVNYYYDTASFDMLRRNETVRVRLKESEMNLEYKTHRSYVNETRVCEEKTSPINILPKSITVEQFELFYIGCMTTQRTNYVIDDYIISLDKNFYLGIVDYEIEVESTSTTDFPSSLMCIFDGNSSAPGKFTRFVCALNKFNESV